MSEEPVRLSKLMAERGLCSRREADEYISRGLVLVDGQPVNVLGTKVLPSQKIELAKAAAKQQQALATILLNKPIGFVSGQPEKGYLPAVSLNTPENRWTESAGPTFPPSHLKGPAPAGRAHMYTEGVRVFPSGGQAVR